MHDLPTSIESEDFCFGLEQQDIDWNTERNLLRETGALDFFDLGIFQNERKDTVQGSQETSQTASRNYIINHFSIQKAESDCCQPEPRQDFQLQNPTESMQAQPVAIKQESEHPLEDIRFGVSSRPVRACKINNYVSGYYAKNYDAQESARRQNSNETKNIPKNYGKAILSFIERNREQVSKLLESSNVTFEEFIEEFRQKKSHINTIADLRDLWTTGSFAREMRILSNLFLRKHSLRYIFHSRVMNFASHIKHRKKLQEALTRPQQFNNIKDY